MITVLACGDIGAKRGDLGSLFDGCRAALRSADLCFGQLETTISDRGAKVPNARLAMRSPPAMAAAAKEAGFDVMSFAGNHCLDFGYEAFDDTRTHAANAGLILCGAGDTLADARRPAILEVQGLNVAFIAASTILPEGYAAESDKPGCAPMRAHTVYEQIEHDQPGTPARVRSFAHRGDLAALIDAIQSARFGADAVLVSLHWGIHMVRAALGDYQIEIAHAAIDAGADAILGHHPHLLKGVEFYRRRPIFYSLGNFAIEQPHIWDPAIVHSASFRHLMSLNPTWNLDQVYALPPDTRMTGIAKLTRDVSGDWQVRFLPAWIGDDSVPRLLASEDSRFSQVADFIRRSSEDAGFDTIVAAAGNELLLRPGRNSVDVARS
jgi:poly-gamma-glutamate capsule biosynthesis protein CapA/YwtB (metallophosphatase superfamily)